MRIGSRRSALALVQAHLVAEQLSAAGHGDWEIVPMTTSGDRGAREGDKARWVIELEDALLRSEIDLAVHSAKDLPGELPDGLALLGAPARASPGDVLCGASTLGELEPGARIGTSSIRRMAQLRAAREDLDVVAMRGNVDTRLEKLTDGSSGLRAIVLARAGLERLGREGDIGGELDPRTFVPAPGQGALALEGRADADATRLAVAAITDPSALACLLAERALAATLDASCNTPLGALATPIDAEQLRLSAWVGLPDGSAWALDELTGPTGAPEALGAELAARLTAAGAGEMLRRAEEMAGVASA